MMEKIMCRQGHIWKSRVKKPKRCPTCSSVYLWPLITEAIPETSPLDQNMFQVQIKTKEGTPLLYAAIHGWMVENFIEEYTNKFPNETFHFDAMPGSKVIQGFRFTIGFTSDLDKDDEISFENHISVFEDKLEKGKALTGKIKVVAVKEKIASASGGFRIDMNKLSPILDNTQNMGITFSFKHISKSFISDYTNMENPQPVTPSIWQLDYTINAWEYNTSPFLEEIFELINGYMEEWLVKTANANILFHQNG